MQAVISNHPRAWFDAQCIDVDALMRDRNYQDGQCAVLVNQVDLPDDHPTQDYEFRVRVYVIGPDQAQLIEDRTFMTWREAIQHGADQMKEERS